MVVMGAAAALLLSSCLTVTPTFDASTDPAPIKDGVLTYAALDGLGAADTYDYERSGGTLTVSAPATNQGGNRREVYWPLDAPPKTNERSCQSWDDSTQSLDQQGIALRIAPTADGLGTRAMAGDRGTVRCTATWVLNVHVWDTTIERDVARAAAGALLPRLSARSALCQRDTSAMARLRRGRGEHPPVHGVDGKQSADRVGTTPPRSTL